MTLAPATEFADPADPETEPVIVDATDRPDKVPTEVMFGCAALDTFAAYPVVFWFRVVTYVDPIDVPCHVPELIVPTDVNEEPVTLELSDVPVNTCAFAVIATLAAVVICPLLLTVNVALCVPLPYAWAVTAVFVIENSVPVNVRPVPAVYVPAPENWTNVTGSVPIVVTGSVIT